jgi:hypothetical protein
LLTEENDMNEETLKFLRELASQLGTTAEHLWGVLVAQAPISGITFLVLTTLSLCVLGAIAFFIRREYKKPDGEGNIDLVIFCSMVFVFLGAFTLVGICVNADTVAAAFFNPEYWALQELLRMLPR